MDMSPTHESAELVASEDIIASISDGLGTITQDKGRFKVDINMQVLVDGGPGLCVLMRGKNSTCCKEPASRSRCT